MSEQEVISEIIEDLTSEIRAKQIKILPKIGRKLNQTDPYSFQQFNGLFGGKNNTFVDSVRTQFADFDDFFAQWLKGLIDRHEERQRKRRESHGRYYSSESSLERIFNLLQDDEIRDLVKIFLERNFYKQLNERTRQKPNENLWSIWFGYNLVYGLLMAPWQKGDSWGNDKSEIRRVQYSYWTIGQVLAEGFIDPSINKRFRFKKIDDFIIFYQSILKRLSVSPYEHSFYDLYIKYLEDSTDIMEEPFLIPEFRYAGLEKNHIHRLDFTILNVHTSEFIGFELSPASTHMNIKNLKQKQYEVNEELSKKWSKEMTKRNDYFKDYNITIITFTDSDLLDIEQCFSVVKSKLQARKVKVDLNAQLQRLQS